MSTAEQTPAEVYQDNERSLDTLIRAVTLSQNQFSLILVRCNYTRLRNYLVGRLKERSPIPFCEYTLPETAKTLFTSIRVELGNSLPDGHPPLPAAAPRDPCYHPAALMIFGLESVVAIDQVLLATNLVREELSKTFPFPLVLWVNDRVLAKLDRLAPDLKSWAGNTIISFDVAIADIVRALQEHTDRLFAAILNTGDEYFLPTWAVFKPPNGNVWGTQSLRRTELEFALNRIFSSGATLDPALQASLDFLLGQDAHAQGELTTALECYEHSLAFWDAESERQQAEPLSSSFVLLPAAIERAACVLIYLGLWWRSYAMLQRTTYVTACEQARSYFRRGLKVFEQANRQDLIARFIIPLAETLQKLQRWDELETLAKGALVLHKLYSDSVRQARDHGFLAEVAIARSAWMDAIQHVQTAMQILETIAETLQTDDATNPHLECSLEIAQRYHQSWYLLLLARAEAKLGNVDAAIEHLEAAHHQTYPPDDPQLYIEILRLLRDLYFQKGRYLEAFRTKQTRRSLEHQYGFRAFVGALRLEPQRHLLASVLDQINPQALLAQEIKASGRQQDVNRLVARMARNDLKLTVIHGPSGVGKSSIVYAGLAPALRERVIGDRVAVPILLDLYTDWQTTLINKLSAIMATDPMPPAEDTVESPPLVLDTPIAYLRQITKLNRLAVVIFDQFEEFFFVHDTLADRRSFYEFLRDCLELDYVKVVLTLREDYLHYLLEFQRLASTDRADLDSITDILSKDVRYPLGDFSPADAASIIRSLTSQAQYYLDDNLIDALVADLAGEFGEVRAIELQVVGAELQAEGITTLAQYEERGPKERLVAKSLESVVQDCGPENEQAARIVLFLLTNENGTRPLKTRDDLETDLVDLGLTTEIEKLDLVLEVLVGSGLAFLVPEMPADRYQLVHDYLVSFIRNQQVDQIEQLKEELEREREERRLLEKDISELRKEKQLLETEVQRLFRVLSKVMSNPNVSIVEEDDAPAN